MNYTIYHIHSDQSNGVTNVDSVTKYHEYIEKAQSLGMKAMGFSEHGSVFGWWNKKKTIEKAGMKYLHGVECYLTSKLWDVDDGVAERVKVRDNYHCVLVAKNHAGFKEINKMVTRSFNREGGMHKSEHGDDWHFYYTPRISMEELFATSDNVIVTTACIGGVLYKGSEEDKQRMLKFLTQNKHRCFLEIQHHSDIKQVEYNKSLLKLSSELGLNLIAGTDTHALNDEHVMGRKILQTAKGVYFQDEDGWDLTFKSYPELCAEYEKQNALPREVWLEAIENTNRLADMVEEFSLDKTPKYPKIYDKPMEKFRENIQKKRMTHPHLNKRHDAALIDKIIEEEIAVYEKTKSIDFMLMQEYLRDWERSKGIYCGAGRGSVSGSLIAYILGITEMDSIKFNLNFFRFQNPHRVTMCDIDTDYGTTDREAVKKFLILDRMNLPTLQASEIITFNTIATKGAVRDVGRALQIPLPTVDEISKMCDEDGGEDEARKKYPELFKYVDIVNGTIVSIGIHPGGVLLSDTDIASDVGLCTTATSMNGVSMLNMKELEDLFYTKLDILGVDNIALINQTCDMVGIERLTPDNVDLNDMAVWRSIRDDTVGIFQWESNSAQAYLKEFLSETTLEKVSAVAKNFSMIKWFSFGNGLIRPACSSFRKEVAKGVVFDNGLTVLNDFFSATLGRCTMQEDIMSFLVEFCGYSQAESDTVRRGIAKKAGTEQFLPEIESRFIKHTSEKFGVPVEQCEVTIKPLLQMIVDASSYAFSWNHSDSYSCIGYICGYLRHYYPVEFLTVALNVFGSKEEKVAEFTAYAKKIGIKIYPPRFGESVGEYRVGRDKKSIYKGIASIKFLNPAVANQLFTLGDNQYSTFMDLLCDIETKTSLNSKQLDILIKLDYFIQFGNARELSEINIAFINIFNKGEAKRLSRDKLSYELSQMIAPYVTGKTKDGKDAAQFTFVDIVGAMRVFEKSIRDLDMFDFPYSDKIKAQEEFLGYVDLTTGKDEDRPLLFVKDIYPLKRKKDGKQFGYSVIARSIGSGIETRYTAMNRVFKMTPIEKGDVIRCTSYERDGQYFTLTGYSKI